MHPPRACFCLIADFPLQGSIFISHLWKAEYLSTSADRPGQVMLLQFLPPSDWIECRSTIQLILPNLFKWKNPWHPSHIAEDLFGPLSLLFSYFSARSRPFCNVYNPNLDSFFPLGKNVNSVHSMPLSPSICHTHRPEVRGHPIIHTLPRFKNTLLPECLMS